MMRVIGSVQAADQGIRIRGLDGPVIAGQECLNHAFQPQLHRWIARLEAARGERSLLGRQDEKQLFQESTHVSARFHTFSGPSHVCVWLLRSYAGGLSLVYHPCADMPPSSTSTLPLNNFTGSLKRYAMKCETSRCSHNLG